MHSDKKDDFKKKKIKTTCTNFFFVELLTQKQIHLVLQYVVFFRSSLEAMMASFGVVLDSNQSQYSPTGKRRFDDPQKTGPFFKDVFIQI